MQKNGNSYFGANETPLLLGFWEESETRSNKEGQLLATLIGINGFNNKNTLKSCENDVKILFNQLPKAEISEEQKFFFFFLFF